MRIKICIITPDGVFQNEEAEEIVLPTRTGQIGVLSGHAPLITALNIGKITFRKRQTWKNVALIGGFALVKEETVTILVTNAFNASMVDKKEAEKNFIEAKERLNKSKGEKEKIEANFQVKRARAIFSIAEKEILKNILKKKCRNTLVHVFELFVDLVKFLLTLQKMGNETLVLVNMVPLEKSELNFLIVLKKKKK